VNGLIKTTVLLGLTHQKFKTSKWTVGDVLDRFRHFIIVTIQLGAYIKLFSHILQDLQIYLTKTQTRPKVNSYTFMNNLFPICFDRLCKKQNKFPQISLFTEEKIAVN